MASLELKEGEGKGKECSMIGVTETLDDRNLKRSKRVHYYLQYAVVGYLSAVRRAPWTTVHYIQ